MSQEKRPTTALERDVLNYLNDLRDSGITNMFGAAPFVADQFDLTIKQSRELLSLWMDNFNNESNYTEVKIKN